MEQKVNWVDVFGKVAEYMEGTAQTSSFIGYNIVVLSTVISIILFFVVKNTKVPGVIALLVAMAFGAFFLVEANEIHHENPYILVGKLSQKYRITNNEKYRDDSSDITYHVALNISDAFDITAEGKGQQLTDFRGDQTLETTHQAYLKLYEKGEVTLIYMPHNNKVYGFITPEGEVILE